jgi:alpha-L-rhamnosidase
MVAIMVLSMTNLAGNALPVTLISDPAARITNLKVQAAVTPLAVEDKNPVFSWQMVSEKIGQKQSAYQIIVNRERDKSIIWNSGKVISDLSTDIRYKGNALEPETTYSWNLTVWDAKGKSCAQSSWFETGLMNPAIEAWEGAKWIGTIKLTLDATSASLFEIKTDFRITPGSKAASIILGANDFRFKDSYQNIESVKGENYIRFELDISGVGTEKGAVLNIYRVGYGKNDSPDLPYSVISAEKYPQTNINKIITEANKNSFHSLSISVDASNITLQIDSQTLQNAVQTVPSGVPGGAPPTGGGPPRRGRGSGITITNYGTGGNFNTFPNLNSVGFASRPGDEVVFTNYMILNKGQSSPDNNVVFDANTGPAYSLFEKLPGITLGAGGTEITVKNNTEKTIVGYSDPSYGSLTMLRTEFSTGSGKKVAKAKMYITSMGANEVYINGKRMGADWFGPGDSQFRETLCYYAYDVTGLIENGSNSIGAILSPGWYTGYMTFTPGNFNFFGDTEALLAKLVITYSDGTKDIIVSNPDTWKLYKNGPIEYGSFFQGERYNAKKEAAVSVNGNNKGWSTSAYDDSKWAKAGIVKQRDWIKFGLVARYDQAVRIAEILQAKKVMEVHSNDEHTYTYNMGVNMVGVPSVTIPAGWLKEGDVVIMRYGEQLYPGFPGDEQEYIDLYGNNGKGKNIAGRILTESYRGALATDFYTATNNKEVVIQPSATYRGYQYIQITIPDHAGPLPLENVKGLVLSSDKLPAGTYTAETTDNITGTYANQLFKNIQRSQLGNFFTIPTDCPQRNERMGWTGDAQAYTRTSTYNSDTRNFFRQWMVALRNDQGAGSTTEAAGGIGSTVPTYNRTDGTNFPDGTTWAAAVCMVPWQLYTQYADKQIIEENIEAMMAWLNGMDFYNFSDKYTHLSSKTSGLSDWLAVDNNTPAQLVNNAIYIYMMEVTAIMAEATGKTEYARTLRERHALARTEWNEVYVDRATGKTINAGGALVHTQTSYATPLNFNTFSDENIKKAQDYLAELAATPSASNKGDKTYPRYSITTGFSGTPNILPALSRSGYVREAYNMFTCNEYASWLYPVIKGSTSIWERWNGYELAFRKGGENSMNSFNHFALGAVGQWMYEFQLGITNDHANGEAGYKHFILQPAAGEKYTSLKGSYTSSYGVIFSSWTGDGKGNMTSFKTVVPANTTATLYLPVNVALSKFKGTKGVKFVKKTNRNNIVVAEYELLSGSFNFTVTADGVDVITL